MFGIRNSKIEVDIDEKIIEEILSRGVEKIYPSKEFLKSKMLKGERLSIYLGIDPTGPSLHLGHLIPLLKLSKFQKLGHQIILLIGDFTAMIGDPTDKTATRRKLSRDEVLENLKEYQKQASKFISFNGTNKALFKFNSEWLSKLNFEQVLDLASNMTVQQMIERDMFSTRMKEGKPIYIHEFLYPLMQGYDSVALNVDGEIGGNDQTFNMLTGRNLIKIFKNKEKFVISTKLLSDSSGKKMGKTEDNMISLKDDSIEMFGKVMSWSDEMIVPGFEVITQSSPTELESIKNSITSGQNPRDFKIRLAKELVSICYGIESAERAQESFENIFTKGGVPEDVEEVTVTTDSMLVEVLLSKKIISSKSEWRRLVSEGAVTKMDTEKKVENPDEIAELGVYKIGKRRFVKIKTD